jgi:hypothetical protein
MHYAVSLLLIAVTTLGASAWAYEDVIVSDGGTLVDIVTYKMVI